MELTEENILKQIKRFNIIRVIFKVSITLYIIWLCLMDSSTINLLILFNLSLTSILCIQAAKRNHHILHICKKAIVEFENEIPYLINKLDESEDVKKEIEKIVQEDLESFNKLKPKLDQLTELSTWKYLLTL